MDISRLYMAALIGLTIPCFISSDTTSVPPASTATATQKPTMLTSNDASPSTQKPNMAQSPTTTDNKTTQPPTDNKTTQPPTSTDNKTAQPPTSTDNTTAQPPTSTDNKTTQPPTPTDNKTTQPPTPTDNKTAQPPTPTDNKTAQPPTPTDNKTTQPPTPTDNKTAQPPTTTDNKTATVQPQTKPDNNTPTLPPTTIQSTAAIPSSGDEIVYINEIVLDKSGGFKEIELQLSKQLDITHYAMVMVDGTTNKNMSVVYLKDMIQQDNNLLIFTFNSSQPVPRMKEKGTGIAIYDTNKMNIATDGTVNEVGLVDALVIGKTYTEVSEQLTNMLTPGVNPFILDPTIYGELETISRCSPNQLRNTDMFALIYPSFGKDNKQKCDEGLAITSDFAIKINDIDCRDLKETNKTVSKFQLTVKFLINYIVKQVNTECQCGVTGTNIIDPIVHCCDGASVDMRFVSPSQDQLKKLEKSFQSFIQNTQYISVNNHLYSLDSACHENCCDVQKHPNPQATEDDKAKNVSLTVAVIVSCLVVFMIILGVVIMYMRKKKGAVYQFRMSRLEEDEDELVADGQDQEEFIGGQEATFDLKHR